MWSNCLSLLLLGVFVKIRPFSFQLSPVQSSLSFHRTDESVSTMHGQAPAVERESCDEQARFSWGSESLMQPALLYSLLLLLCTETGGALANHSMFCLHALHICRHFLQSRPGFFFKLYFVVQIACNCCIHSCTL